jgi:hypothetical protein
MNQRLFDIRKLFSPRFVARWRQLTVSAIVGGTLVACAGMGGVAKDSPEDVKKAAVTQRVQERWKAIIASDAEKSYSYFSPGSKASTSLDQYKKKARLTGFREAQVENVVCEPELCKVTMRTTLDHRLMKGIPLPVTETWVLEKGEYWYVWPL